MGLYTKRLSTANAQREGKKVYQYSVYVRFAASNKEADRYVRMIKSSGHVSLLRITDAQFGKIKNFYGKSEIEQEQRTVKKLPLLTMLE